MSIDMGIIGDHYAGNLAREQELQKHPVKRIGHNVLVSKLLVSVVIPKRSGKAYQNQNIKSEYFVKIKRLPFSTSFQTSFCYAIPDKL